MEWTQTVTTRCAVYQKTGFKAILIFKGEEGFIKNNYPNDANIALLPSLAFSHGIKVKSVTRHYTGAVMANLGVVVANSGVVMVHCVGTLIDKICCMFIATCSATTFYHNGLSSHDQPGE